MENEGEDKIGKKLDLADSWLTKFGIILKKHWGKLLLLLFCWVVYWAFTQPAPAPEPSPIEEPYVDEVMDTIYPEDSAYSYPIE